MEKSFCSQSFPNIMSLINELMLYTRKLCFPIGRFVSMSSIYELKTKFCLIRMQLMKLYKERPELTSQFDVSKMQKQPSSVIQVHLDQFANFGPLTLNVCVTVSSSINC